MNLKFLKTMFTILGFCLLIIGIELMKVDGTTHSIGIIPIFCGFIYGAMVGGLDR